MVPQIATSWTQVDDLTWTMDLRSDATFSNGEPVNAETVVSMVEAFERDDFIPFSLPREFDFIAGTRALDADTVEFTTTAPHALLPRYMSFFYLVRQVIWPRTARQDWRQTRSAPAPLLLKTGAPNGFCCAPIPSPGVRPKLTGLKLWPCRNQLRACRLWCQDGLMWRLISDPMMNHA